jgi:hypothetical protein
MILQQRQKCLRKMLKKINLMLEAINSTPYPEIR